MQTRDSFSIADLELPAAVMVVDDVEEDVAPESECDGEWSATAE